jgi:hypothetical protein
LLAKKSRRFAPAAFSFRVVRWDYGAVEQNLSRPSIASVRALSLRLGDGGEHQSSSGVIFSTGTGSTGWARSINQERNGVLRLPTPEERRLAYFVREAFPGSGFATSLTYGYVEHGASVRVISEMNAGGVIFGDGIEDDRMQFAWGTQAEIRIAPQRLKLVV